MQCFVNFRFARAGLDPSASLRVVAVLIACSRRLI